MSQVEAGPRYGETRGRLAYLILALIPVAEIAWLAVLAFLGFKLVRHFL